MQSQLRAVKAKADRLGISFFDRRRDVCAERPNRLASEGDGPAKRRKVIVSEWDLRETR